MVTKISENYQNKPSVPHRKVITPSSLYKANCPRCTWMSYWHGFSLPVNMALQQKMARLQENSFDGISTQKISPDLPDGWTTLHKGKFSSLPLPVNGNNAGWKLYGELDLLSKNSDGSFSIIDGKVSMKNDPTDLVSSYWTQLEAYVYMLENPEVGTKKEIATIGLLQWKLTETFNDSLNIIGFQVEQKYIPVDRNPEKFLSFMENFISVLDGDFPNESPECRDCALLKDLRFYE